MNLASLVAQPQSPQPPQQQGSASGGDMASLSSLMQGQQGGQAAGGQAPPMDHATVVAALRHLGEFQRRFKALLATPGIGEKSIRGPVLEMMADTLGEGFVTLPQVMSQLSTFPSDPLAQKQWTDKHYQNTIQATHALLDHYAATNPRTGMEPLPPPPSTNGHTKLMEGLVNGLKGRAPRKR